MKATSHLTAGLVSILLLVLGLIGFNFYARSLEQRYVNALAPLDLTQTINGIALQRAALFQSDLLPVYGSSEITMTDTPYDAEKFFAMYPTGFTVFQVANLGASSISIAQDLAALGPDLRGKKLVISFSTADFTMGDLPVSYYAGNYSRMHAYEMIFSPYLSMPLKISAAKRMLEFPATLKGDPFLQFTLVDMQSLSKLGRSFYYLGWPLGELQIQIMHLQDHADVIIFLRSNHIDPNVKKIPQSIDWSKNFSAALAEQKLSTSNNPYGVDNSLWWFYQHKMTYHIKPGSNDKGFVPHVQTMEAWSDFQILLNVLQELGAKPLLLGRPMNVHLWEMLGVSENAQNVYYTQLHAITSQYQMPLVDYEQHGTDIYFSIDQGAHTSRYGWVYVDQTLDEFFHGRIQP